MWQCIMVKTIRDYKTLGMSVLDDISGKHVWSGQPKPLQKVVYLSVNYVWMSLSRGGKVVA